MSKYKSQPKLSPENYLRTRARALPLGECYINENWKDSGMAFILVSRRHITGNLTLAVFQADLYCLGIKDAFWHFNEYPELMSELKARHEELSGGEDHLIKVDYVLAHNIIYGAVAYAEDLGFRPHKGFALAQYILEEDDERIESMNIECGMNGRPAVFVGFEKHPSRIFDILDRTVGRGNYTIISGEGNFEDDDEDQEEEDEEEDDYFDDNELDDNEEKPESVVKPMTRDMINLANERLMNFLGEQNFSSMDEMKNFIEKNVTGKKIDEIVPKKKGPKPQKEKSDDLMYQAYQVEPEEGIKLAFQALKLDPESIRAYNYLAQNEPVPFKAAAMLEKAIDLAEKQLGGDFFKENKGHFWGLHETRPYMTAKFELAQRLEVMDRKKEAIKIYQEMLKLNPNDNQGVRYELARLLLIFHRYDLYYKLHKKYKEEESAFWLYNYAYFVFKTQGTGKTSDEALQKAYMANKHVIGIMIEKEKMPDQLKEYYAPGQHDEAAYYLMDNIEMWMKDKETVRWVVNFRKKMKS